MKKRIHLFVIFLAMFHSFSVHTKMYEVIDKKNNPQEYKNIKELFVEIWKAATEGVIDEEEIKNKAKKLKNINNGILYKSFYEEEKQPLNALMFAAGGSFQKKDGQEKSEHIIKLLYKLFADPDAQLDPKKLTPLMYAVKNNVLKNILQLENKSDLSLKNSDEKTAYDLASQTLKKDLIQYGIDTLKPDQMKQREKIKNELLESIKEDNFDKFEKIMATKKIFYRSYVNKALLNAAFYSLSNASKMIEKLLEGQFTGVPVPDINSVDSEGNTALMLASGNVGVNSVAIVRTILEYQDLQNINILKINQKNNLGQTALDIADLSKSPNKSQIQNILLKNGAERGIVTPIKKSGNLIELSKVFDDLKKALDNLLSILP